MPRVTVITFGYDTGPAPEGCRWVMDVRDIPADVVDGLWDRTGLDKVVADKVLATPEAKAHLAYFRSDILPKIEAGDRIAVGCSIGVHRSVAVAAEIVKELRAAGFDARQENRDLAANRDTPRRIEAMTFETRAIGDAGLTITMDGDKPRIDGRAILFNSWSTDLGGFREQILPGAIQLDADVVATFDHDSSMILGRSSAGTLQIRSDSQGHAFTAYPPNTTWANDLRESMARGDVKGCSFRMYVDQDNWYVDNGQVCRDIVEARVFEFTVTALPAYPETTAEARDHARALSETLEAPVEASEARAGRVLSDANETALKDALAALETASDTLESVLSQVDPTFVPDAEEDPATEDDTTDPGMENEGGAPEDLSRSLGGAPGTPRRVFVPGLGFIPTKEK